MAELPVFQHEEDSHRDQGGAGGCGTSCGNGLEKIYPSAAVRYGAMRWIGEFSYRENQVFKCGGKVVISTDRGVEIGEQVSLTCKGCSSSITREQIKRYIDNCGPEFYRLRAGRIIREANPQDLLEHEKLNETLIEDIDRASLLAAQFNLDMKIVTVEHLLGGERIVFYFCSEGRVDFRDLVKELARHYQTRIQMVQVGARDEARLVADYEICGRECCCKNFLKKLRPVSMRMAKLQKSTLDPSKVSGRCGRLRCCLRYEHEGYEELDKKLPRVNSWVETAEGVAQVIDRQILTQLVLVRGADGRDLAVPIEEIRATNVPPPPPVEPGAEPGRQRGESRRGDRRREQPGKPPAGGAPQETPDRASAEPPQTRFRPDKRDLTEPKAPGEPAGEAENRDSRRLSDSDVIDSDVGASAEVEDETGAGEAQAPPDDSRSVPGGSETPREAGPPREGGPRRRRRRRRRSGRGRPDAGPQNQNPAGPN